ncbi:LiaI-LiaF-like domain-containing protein [Jeongeupia chitinilytica]|uniref:LiaI-LiaF-like transmembrane region domain-containing protein n=1 Tax=Jeongeupia chitinilytica TaxID=1041641 RepID=A0ABQ3H537_9NEIS|nr:DUF5668 domain-containing protein [Jeongeupia chitinilytica]GHD68022.1 hypothetical protein GCM10007350_32580 [Jeongeupia chitinilytica]
MFRLFVPVLLIVIGTALFLRNLGVLPQLDAVLHAGWPLLLVAFGAFRLLRPHYGCHHAK